MDELFCTPGFDEFPLNLHQAMIQDTQRMRAYEQAVASTVKPGDVVVDIGSGTGVMAFLAHRAGARRVIALERTEIIHTARRVKELNFPGAEIEFLQIDAQTGRLPRVRADVLISELLGNFGLEENVVQIVSRVRKQLLRPQGRMIPSSLDLLVCPVQSDDVFFEVSAWSRRHRRINWTPFQELAYARIYHTDVERMRLLAKPDAPVSIDFRTTTRMPRRLEAEFLIERAGALHGFASWFRAELAPGVVIDTGPRSAHTHWGQTFFPIGPPETVKPGSTARFRLSLGGSNQRRLWRWSGEIIPRGGASDVPREFSFSAQHDSG